jgi:hypothetical protein
MADIKAGRVHEAEDVFNELKARYASRGDDHQGCCG